MGIQFPGIALDTLIRGVTVRFDHFRVLGCIRLEDVPGLIFRAVVIDDNLVESPIQLLKGRVQAALDHLFLVIRYDQNGDLLHLLKNLMSVLSQLLTLLKRV